MFSFLKFYLVNILKKWWVWLNLIPLLVPLFLFLDSYYNSSKYSQYIERVDDYMAPWRKWIVIIIFWFAHIIIIYKLWKRKENCQTDQEFYNIPEKYSNIAREIDKFLPEKSIQIREDFVNGYKCLTNTAKRDTKIAICIHLKAYKEILESLNKHLTDGSINITIDMTKIREKLEDNYSQLNDYNTKLGLNKNPKIDDYAIQKLIDDINDNLNSFFALL